MRNFARLLKKYLIYLKKDINFEICKKFYLFLFFSYLNVKYFLAQNCFIILSDMLIFKQYYNYCQILTHIYLLFIYIYKRFFIVNQ